MKVNKKSNDNMFWWITFYKKPMLSTSDLEILLKRGFSQMPEILCVLLGIVRGKKSEEFGSVSFKA